MYEGDRSRKQTLVDHGFRLPSALDNRPLNINEFEDKINQIVYVSATPSKYELEKSNNEIIEQIIRPTGLVDPTIEIMPSKNQVDHLFCEINKTIKDGNKVKANKIVSLAFLKVSKETGLSINEILSKLFSKLNSLNK